MDTMRKHGTHRDHSTPWEVMGHRDTKTHMRDHEMVNKSIRHLETSWEAEIPSDQRDCNLPRTSQHCENTTRDTWDPKIQTQERLLHDETSKKTPRDTETLIPKTLRGTRHHEHEKLYYINRHHEHYEISKDIMRHHEKQKIPRDLWDTIMKHHETQQGKLLWNT